MSSGRKMRLGVMTSCKVTLMHMSGPTLKFSSALSCILGFPGGSAGKESACNGGDLGLIPGLGRCHGEGNGYPLQYSGLESSMDRGAWWATVHGVTKSRIWLSNFHFYIPHPTFSHDLQKHIPSFLLNTLSSEESKAFQTEDIYASIDFSYPFPLKSFL